MGPAATLGFRRFKRRLHLEPGLVLPAGIVWPRQTARSGTHRSRLTAALLAHLALTVFAVLVVLGVAVGVGFSWRSAGAQTVGTLVSNLTQAEQGTYALGVHAQGFRTGPSSRGYQITEIQVKTQQTQMVNPSGRTYVAIKADNGGSPEAELVKLNSPSSMNQIGINTFTAPRNTLLAADTTYWLVFNEEIGESNDRVESHLTNSNAEDTDSAAGWTIGDSHLVWDDTNGVWSGNQHATLLSIRGYTTEDPNLGELILKDQSNNSIQLDPVFVPNTTEYQVRLSNKVTSVTVLARTKKSNSLVSIGGAQQSLGVAQATISPNAGESTITIVVSDPDGVSKMYNVVVIRAQPLQQPGDCPPGYTWCATMRVGYESRPKVNNEIREFGYKSSATDFGDLTPDTFSHLGAQYTVQQLVYTRDISTR